MALTGFFYLRKHWTYQISAYRIGLRAARRAGNEYGETWILINLGVACRELGRFDEALQRSGGTHYDRKRPATRGLKATRRQTSATPTMQYSVSRTQQRYLCKPWPLLRKSSNGQAKTLVRTSLSTSLANTYRRLSRFDDALHCSGRALAIARENGDQWGEGFAHHSLGDTFRDLGQLCEATDHLRQGLIIREEIGDQHGQARIFYSLQQRPARMRARSTRLIRRGPRQSPSSTTLATHRRRNYSLLI